MAANAGVSDRPFKRRGRWWKKHQAKDGFLKDKLESLLSGYKSFIFSFPFLFLYFRTGASINEMPPPILCFVII